MLTRIDHVGIACRDLDATVAFYRKTFGFEVFHEEVNEDQGIREAMLRINGTDDGGASYLQLMEPTRPDCVVARFLERHGEGVHHIAFGSADVADALAGAVAAGVTPVIDGLRTGSMGSLVTFLHPKDCHGVLTELVQARAVDRPDETTPEAPIGSDA
ncbi:methylmalonyl-CoA epimerase [Actinocrinis sp.]|uniref:methylmalonyl-CoA epimerase n=1 Tax=Actinocrinis sp. TaxID=1920516 RepID=UPI002D3D91A0|nr:methylmalonyl-CoA epimerase [Actinocrinis sp.]HZP51739.1 methylmalonyl-CoA epimerase [Actinocrinis sp.]